jgi:hypothetical protein
MEKSNIDIDKISRIIIQPAKNLILKMHIKLLNENEGRKENFHKLFISPEGNKYLKLDLQSFLTLELHDDNWSKDKTIIIDQKNIYHLIKGLKKMVDNLYTNDIFVLNKNKQIVIYKDIVEKYTEKIYNLKNNQRIIIKPAIIFDENQISYEGVVIYINKTENYVELPIDAFESLYYALSKVDLFTYSQELLNYYISCIKGEKIELKEVGFSDNKKAHPLLMEDNKEEVKGNLIKSEEENVFNY